MCWQCDHPGSTRLDYLDYVRGLITRFGWAVQGVERDKMHPPWAYTVGLTARRKPELVVTGMTLAEATGLLNDVAAHLMHAAAPAPGEQIPLRGGPLFEIVRVEQPAAHLVMAVELYGTRLRALQLVHADDRGHWPWDVGYRGVRGGQPVLGVRSALRGLTA
jgi:hypothetical protein